MHTTIPISSRIDIRAFATLVRGFQADSYMPRTKSDALNAAVQHLAALYNRKHNLPPIETVQEAADFLRAIGLPLETSDRPTKAVLQATADEVMLMEGGEPGRRTTKRDVQLVYEQDMYTVAAEAMKRLGLNPPTREEYEAKKLADKVSEGSQC